MTIPTIVGILILEDTMPLSGKEMIKLFLTSGWIILRQRGSHVLIGKNGERETIPLHRELKKGLERKLLKRLRK